MKTKTFLSIFLATTVWAQVPSINVSGRDGVAGSAGVSFDTSRKSSGLGDGRNGRSGGHAGPSTAGQKAGSIQVHLRDKEIVAGQPFQAIVEMDATYLTADGSRQQVSKNFSTATAGYMYLQAKGGRGGDGGQGGHGEGGQNGADGCNATQSSSGCNGDDGGDGGRGGDGTSGSSGGVGGTVEVKLKSEDSHLILLVSEDVGGGPGGSAGRNGQGGSAGSGGSGGSSYSWTEQVYAGESCSNTDNGNGSYTRNCTPQYNTVSHSNPGGFSGSSGSAGSSGTGNVSAGAPGQDGRYTIQVDENGVTKSYRQAFRIHIESYSVIDKNNDNIIEPDESLTIENMVVRNSGGMPWKSKAKFMVFLENSGWIVAEPLTLEVPALQIGQSVQLKEILKFKIRQTDSIGKEKRWTTADQIVPKNLVTRVNRSQSGFTLVRPINITFPLEITPLVSKYSVGPGEAAKILWRIRNISQKSLGAESESLRKMLQTIRVNSKDTQDVQFQYLKDEISFTMLDQDRLKELALLAPGEEVLIEGEAKFSEKALAYTDRNVEVHLGLGQLNSPQSIQKIQIQNFKFKVSQLYNYNSDAQWVLIVNNNTEREEYLAWKRLAEELSIKMDVWDISYYGQLMLSKVMHQSKGSFAENYKYKTVIILNNSHQASVDQEPIRTLDQLTQKDFVESLLQGGLGVVVIGPETKRKSIFEKLLIEHKDQEAAVSQGQFFKNLESRSQEIEFGTVGTVESRNFHFFGKPDEESLKKQSSALAQKLLKEEPQNRYIVSYDLDVESLKWKRFSKKFRVQKIMSPKVGNLIVLDVDDRAMHSREFIHSAENILSVFEGMRFRNKLKVFQGLEKVDSPWTQFLADAMIRDLITEQNAALSVVQGRWELIKKTMSGLFSGSRFNQGSDFRFDHFGKMKPVSQLSTKNKSGQELLRVVAALKFYAKKALGMFHILEQEKFVSPISVYLYRRDMGQLQNQLIAGLFPTELIAAHAAVDQHFQDFEGRLKARKSVLNGNSQLVNSRNLLLNPASSSTYSTHKLLDKNLVIPEDKPK